MLLVLAGTLMCLWGCTPARADDDAPHDDDTGPTRWLASRASQVDLPRADFAFSPGFYGNRLFLLGEVHGIAVGQALDLALLQHLHARAGVRRYIGEFDFAQAPPAQREVMYTMDHEDAALVHGIEDLKAAATGPLTLFPLAGEGSPYVGSTLLGRVGGRFGGQQPFEVDVQGANGRVFVDYVLLSRGSPATRPRGH